MDGVDGRDAVVADADQVGAHAVVAGEGVGGMPAPADRLVAFRPLMACSLAFACPGHGEVAGEQPDLFCAVVAALRRS